MRAGHCQHPQSLDTLKLIERVDAPKPKASRIVAHTCPAKIQFASVCE